MDGYPDHLAPKFDEGGGVATPFEEWWAGVSHAFPTVPEDVARHWLHEHWRHSPYEYLRSADYRFDLVKWDVLRLGEVRTRWSDFSEDQDSLIEHGQFLVEHGKRFPVYRTPAFMLEHGDFPTPIIVLDNRDGHLSEGRAPVPRYEKLPQGFILIEGHRRLNIALYLRPQNKLNPQVSIWLMSRA